MKDILTIVIPCKNENDILFKTLFFLNKQNDIKGTNIIISDSSDDNTRDIISDATFDNLNITIIDGGIPSVARNNGAKLCNTPYILFLDADIFLYSYDTIKNCIKICNNYDLITCKFKTMGKYSFAFPLFEFFRDMFIWYSPFAVGGFMLFNKSKFDELGGFNEDYMVAEDYALSNKIKPSKFKVINEHIYTTDRRFKNKGIWYMLKLMIKSFFNKNNPEFFKNDHKYWTK
jgi:predicted glycosyltransferase involved in capsule biosynthesis